MPATVGIDIDRTWSSEIPNASVADTSLGSSESLLTYVVLAMPAPEKRLSIM